MCVKIGGAFEQNGRANHKPISSKLFTNMPSGSTFHFPLKLYFDARSNNCDIECALLACALLAVARPRSFSDLYGLQAI